MRDPDYGYASNSYQSTPLAYQQLHVLHVQESHQHLRATGGDEVEVQNKWEAAAAAEAEVLSKSQKAFAAHLTADEVTENLDKSARPADLAVQNGEKSQTTAAAAMEAAASK